MREAIEFFENNNWRDEPICFEKWLPITENSVPDVKDGYYISNFGRVYSTQRKNGIFMNLMPTENGYLRVNLQLKSGIGRYYLVHRIVMIEFHKISNYNLFQINHIYGDKTDNWDYHLEWCTGSENIIHAYRTGLKVKEKGEDCSYATISNQQAEQIAQLLLEEKYTHKQIAEMVNCAEHIVDNISYGTTWKQIYEKYNLQNRINLRKNIINLSDEDLHLLCKFIQDNKYNYKNKNQACINGLKILFNINYTSNLSATVSRICNKKTRQHITSLYDY